MEGTWSTISHVLTPGAIYDLKEGAKERTSVLGYAHALEVELGTVEKRGVAVFTKQLCSRLHRKIMSKDPLYKGKPGDIRQEGKPGDVVWIGSLTRPENSIYNPTPARHVSRCLDEFLEWLSDKQMIEMGDAGMGLPLAARMAIGHAHFEAVHPFSDGNGRVGRMLMTLQMAAAGLSPLYLSGFIEAEKTAYVAALQQAQKKLRYGAIVEFICESIIASDNEGRKTKTLFEQLPDAWSKRGEFRDKSAALRMLPLLLSHPIFTAKDVAKLLKISAPAAARATNQLVEKKIVRQRSNGNWGRVFAAEEVIELLSRRFAEDPRLALSRAKDLL
jgi:Fic family protein